MPEITPPPADVEPLRPLPRRAAPRASSPRANRPKFALLDGLWIILLVGVALVVIASSNGLRDAQPQWLLTSCGIIAALYLLGWRARDRAAGLTAGLLAATSLPFLHLSLAYPQSSFFALLAIASLFAFVAGSSMAALALAAGATFIRPDGLLLGLLLVVISLAQRRDRSIYGAAIYFVPVLGTWSAQIALGHSHPSFPNLRFHATSLHLLTTPASLLLLWFFLPLLGELSEPPRRARWLPVLLWSVTSLGIAVVYASIPTAAMTLPLQALLFALAGGGLSRLLPTLTGEFPKPGLRYALATVAVIALAGLHYRLG